MSKLKTNEISPFSFPGVGIGGPSSDASAILNVLSTSQGALMPRMTTAQRNLIPSPSTGLLIYNTETLRLEEYDGSGWSGAGNAFSRIKNVIRVVKNSPLDGGDFDSIADAIASISDAADDNLYVVQVGPGVYSEPEITIPPFVFVVGVSMDAVIVEPDLPNHHVFTMLNMSTISFLTIRNAGAGFAGMNFTDVGDFSIAHKVTIYDCSTAIYCSATAIDSYVYLEYVDATSTMALGLKVESANGFIMFVNAENFYIYGDTVTQENPVLGAHITGATTTVALITFGFEGENTASRTAIRLDSGATLETKSGHITMWGTGFSCPNTGSAPRIKMSNCSFSDNTIDFNIAHTGLTGAISVISESEPDKFIIPPNFLAGLFIFDPTQGDIVTSGRMKLFQSDTSRVDVSSLLGESATMGVLEGGGLTAGTGLSVNLAEGFGYLEIEPELYRRIEWDDTSLSLPASTTNYIYFDNTGTLSYSTSLPDTRYFILIGRVVTHATGIELIDNSELQAEHSSNSVDKFLRTALGPVFASGSIVTENGTRQLNITSGTFFLSMVEFSPTGGMAVTWKSFRQDGVGGYTVGSQSTVDNAFWDDGSGTLAALTSSYYAKHSLYVVGDGVNEQYLLVYSQSEYSALTLAQQGSLPTPPTYFTEGVSLIATIIVQQGTTNIVEIRDERPRIGFVASGVAASTYHSGLLGLTTGDDHPQYWRNDGTHLATGDFNLNTHNLTNVGTVNGVTVQTHAARHLPNGSDPETTAAGVTLTPDLANATGTANAFSRSDHIHNVPTATAVGLDTTSTSTQGAAATFARSNHTHAIASGAPSTQTPDQTNTAGSSSNFAKADHIHNIPTAAPIQSNANGSNNQGVAATFSLSDHKHDILTGVVSTITPDLSNSAGSSSSVARADHIHNIPTASASGLNAASTSTQGSNASFARSDHTHAIASGAASTQTPDQANAAGASTNFARADHVHNIPTAAPIQVNANGSNVQGVATTFALSDHKHDILAAAVSTQTPDQANAAGTSSSLARADHVHNIPTAAPIQSNANGSNVQGVAATFALSDHKHDILAAAASTQTPDQSNAAGSSSSLARADHVHNIPTATAVGLDTTSTSTTGAATTFARSNHTHAIASGAPSTQTPDQANGAGSSANFAKADHIHAIVTAAPAANLTASTTNAQGAATSFARSDHSHAITTGAAAAQTPDQVNGAGSSASLARADHVHNIATAAASGLDTTSTSTQGAATTFTRSDHTHAIASGVVSSQTPDAANAAGSSANFAKADHIHNIATAAAVGLDTTSTSTQGAASTFARSNHTHAIASGTPSSQTADAANAAGSSANFAKADHIHNIATAIVGDIGSANAQGSASTFVKSDHTHRGIRSLQANSGGTQRFGNIILQQGGAVTITDNGSGTFTIASTVTYVNSILGSDAATGSTPGTVTVLTFATDSRSVNLSGIIDRPTTSRFRALVAGHFAFSYTMNGYPGTQNRGIEIYARLNGTTLIEGSRARNTGQNTVLRAGSCSNLISVQLAVNDYIELVADPVDSIAWTIMSITSVNFRFLGLV